MGSFVTYLGQHARAACNPRGPRIKKSGADGQNSAMKTYFTTKFRNEPPIPIFEKQSWKKLRQKLLGMFRESNRAEGKHEMQKVSSTRQDREAIATACIWKGTPEFAELLHLSNSCFHCVGRGSEVSLIKSEGVQSATTRCERSLLQLSGPFGRTSAPKIWTISDVAHLSTQR